MVSQPKAPDPYTQAAAQQAANIGSSQASAIINNANETNPYGAVNYKNIGYETIYDAKGRPQKVPRYQRDVTLSPDQQGLLNLQNQMQTNLGNLGVSQSSRLQGLLGQEMNTEGLEEWNRGVAPRQASWDPNAYSADRAKVENALAARYRMQADPVREAENVKLAARGLAPGSQNWGAQQDVMNRQDLEAGYKAIEAGGAEQSRLLGEERAGWQQGQDYTNFLNTLRGGQLQERMALRNQPINEIAALAGGSQVTVPQFQPFSRQGVEAAPIGQYISDAYTNKVNAANATNQGLFGLGGAGIGLLGGMKFFGGTSDRRLKKDIRRIGRKLAGLPLYFFRFIEPICRLPGYDGVQVGVMADEVRKLHPDAVLEVDGYDMVDYGKLLRRH
jgi:hypothetical protein